MLQRPFYINQRGNHVFLLFLFFCCLVKSSKHVKGPVTWQVGVSPAKYGFTNEHESLTGIDHETVFWCLAFISGCFRNKDMACHVIDKHMAIEKSSANHYRDTQIASNSWLYLATNPESH
jgi:hypothetical protein